MCDRKKLRDKLANRQRNKQTLKQTISDNKKQKSTNNQMQTLKQLLYLH